MTKQEKIMLQVLNECIEIYNTALKEFREDDARDEYYSMMGVLCVISRLMNVKVTEGWENTFLTDADGKLIAQWHTPEWDR